MCTSREARDLSLSLSLSLSFSLSLSLSLYIYIYMYIYIACVRAHSLSVSRSAPAASQLGSDQHQECPAAGPFPAKHINIFRVIYAREGARVRERERLAGQFPARERLIHKERKWGREGREISRSNSCEIEIQGIWAYSSFSNKKNSTVRTCVATVCGKSLGIAKNTTSIGLG